MARVYWVQPAQNLIYIVFMAVYTQITEAELVTFLAGYALGTLTSFEGITSGVENTNYKLETSQGQYILTLFEKRTDPADLPYFIALKNHLASNGFPCPEPITTRGGEILRELAGRPAIIISFLEGREPPAPNTTQCHELGKALAQMHIALSDFRQTRKNALGVESWPALWRDRAPETEQLSTGLASLIEADLEAIALDWPQSETLPTGTIHADFFPDNAFFTGDTFTGAIDFYFACSGLLAYDLAVCINAWGFSANGVFSLPHSSALIAGYQSVRPLEQGEISALPILARGAALRFFLTRLIDWSGTPEDAQVRPKDPLDYAARLVFQRAVSDAKAYGV